MGHLSVIDSPSLLEKPMQNNYRRCISCRTVAPRHEFWRIVRTHPLKSIQLDHGMGRSAYLCPNANCLKAAQKKNRLGRALKAPVPDAIYTVLEQRLESNTQARPESKHPTQAFKR